MPELLENADEKLSTGKRRLLDFLWREWKGLQVQIESPNTANKLARITWAVLASGNDYHQRHKALVFSN
jgi:hypothetical protein